LFSTGNSGTLATTREDSLEALSIGAVYLLCTWAGPRFLVNSAGQSPSLASADTVYGLALLTLPPLGLLATLVAKDPSRPLWRALYPGPEEPVAGVILLAGLASLLLNAFDLWPWVWRWQVGAVAYMASILSRGDWIAVIVWLVWGCIFVPLVEEVVFRFGALRFLQQFTSTKAAIAGSSLLFGVSHLGLDLHPDRYQLLNAAWATVFGVVLSYLTVRRSGGIAAAVIAHSARNAVESFSLLISIAIVRR